MTWFTAAALLAVTYLPGALIYRLPLGNRVSRAALSAEERAFWAVVLSVSLSSILTLSLAVIGEYSFDRLVTANLIVCLLVTVVGRTRLTYGGTAARPTWTALIPLSLAAAGLWLYFPSAEYVLGGQDPGTYMNEGIQIAQRGSLIIKDPTVASVPPAYRDLFFPSHENPSYYGLRFMGFFILDPEEGDVVGQFPHLYPAWIAIAYGLNGLSGARQAVGAWAILGLLAVYFAGSRLLGRTAAAAGCALLSVNIIQVWFARYPNAEVVMQAFLFAGLLAYARAEVDGDRFFGPVAGIALGLLLFLRFDAVLALVGVGGAVMLGIVDGRRPRFLFLAPLMLTSAVAGWYLVELMTPYAAYPIGFVRNLQPIHLAFLGTGVLGAAALPWAARHPRAVARVRMWAPIALIVIVITAVVYALFFRTAGGRVAAHDAGALRTFVEYYVSMPALAAAVLGFTLVTRRAFWRDPALLLTASAFGFFFFYKTRIVPDHFWMARRFLPIILPSTLLLAAAAGPWLSTRSIEGPGWRARIGQLGRAVVVLVFVLVLGSRYLDATRQILGHVEYAGVIPRLEELADHLTDDDLLIVESRSASDLHVLGLPLAYIYAKNVLLLNTPRPDRPTFEGFLTWARARYRRLFFLGGGGTDLLSRSVGVSTVTSDRFQVPEYDSPRNAYPQGLRYKEFDFGIYQFVEARDDPGWFSLDVGTMDDLHVVRFHAKEFMEPYSFRWTRDVSYISVLGMRADQQVVMLWLADGGRPEGIDPAHLTVSLDDRLLGSVNVVGGFRPYTFAVPGDVASAAATRNAPARLKLEVSTWNPRDELGVPDDRQLGVMVDRVEVK